MYLVISHIPIFVDGDDTFVDVSWQRDLLLKQVWMAPHFGPVTLLSPGCPISSASPTLNLVRIGDDDGLRVFTSFDERIRAREYWRSGRKRWRSDVLARLPEAKVVHSGSTDVYRPLSYLAHALAVSAGKVTVFVGPDMDPDSYQENPDQSRIRRRIEIRIFDRWTRKGVKTASLALLKEGLVYDRYAEYAANPRAFCHTMHYKRDVISMKSLEARLETLGKSRPLRLVYFGRLLARKGVSFAIDAVARSRLQGTDATLDLYGDGPERRALEKQARDSMLADAVIFHGFVDYGPELFRTLSSFDALLFMPTTEDTPRMLYDAMACGLPFVGTDIPFLRYRAEADRAGIVVPVGDSGMAATELIRLHRDPSCLKDLSRNARVAGEYHAVENWYGKRARWTLEAAGRRPRA